MLNCSLVGVPVESGASQIGCLMGPDAYRTAGLKQTIESLGYSVNDRGNILPRSIAPTRHANTSIHHLSETIGWAQALEEAAYEAIKSSDLPVF